MNQRCISASGDKIIFSNTGRNNIKESFERFDKGTMHKCYVQEKELYGQPMKIYVRYPEIQISKFCGTMPYR